jgi:hypothetical protein
MDSDSILVSFFHNLLEMEIKAKNLYNDMNMRASLKPVGSLEEFYEREKYLHYPLQQVNFKSVVDSESDCVPSPLSRRNSSPMFSRSSMSATITQDLSRFCHAKLRKIPLYAKFCLSMVLGEVGEGNVLQNCGWAAGNIKCVKDLPLVSDFF